MAQVKELINNHQEESSFRDNFLHFLHGKNGTVIYICKYQIPFPDCTKILLGPGILVSNLQAEFVYILSAQSRQTNSACRLQVWLKYQDQAKPWIGLYS